MPELTSSRAGNGRLRLESDGLREEVAALKHEVDKLRRLIFGAKIERLLPTTDVNRPALFGEEKGSAKTPEQHTTYTLVRKDSLRIMSLHVSLCRPVCPAK